MIYALCYMFCMLGVAIIGSYNHMDAFIAIWIAAFVLGSFIRIAYFHAKGRARTSDAVFTYIGTVLSLLMLAFYTEIAVGMLEIEDYLIINLLASFLTLIYAIAKDSAKRKKKSDQIHKLSVKSRQISLLTQTLFGGLSYATAVGLAFLYLYFIDVDSGMIIFFIMLLVPLISLILTLIARAGLQTDISASVTQINKDETFVLTISVTKKTVIPAPFIDLVLELPPGIADTDFDTCRIAMSVNKKTDIQLPLKGMISGRANVGLHSVVISDYLCIFRFAIKSARLLTLPIDIIPDIKRDIDCQELFNDLSAHICYSDEEEATQSLYTTNASPGYEHREYIPGDPMKRVNWKLSSKRSTLMVRLDEAPAMIRPVILMDFIADGYKEEDVGTLLTFERISETVLALLDLCSRQSMECSVFFNDGNGLNKFDVDSVEAVKRLALTFGSIDALKTFGTERYIDNDEVMNACERSMNAVLVSNAPIEKLLSVEAELEGKGINTAVVIDKPTKQFDGFVIKPDGIVKNTQ